MTLKARWMGECTREDLLFLPGLHYCLVQDLDLNKKAMVEGWGVQEEVVGCYTEVAVCL